MSIIDGRVLLLLIALAIACAWLTTDWRRRSIDRDAEHKAQVLAQLDRAAGR